MMRSIASCHRCGRRGHFPTSCPMRPKVKLSDTAMPLHTTPVDDLKNVFVIPNDNSIFRSYLTYNGQKLQGRESKNRVAMEAHAKSMGADRIIYVEAPEEKDK